MPSARQVRRYTAYFPGWATAFGPHDLVEDDERGLVWLFGENQMGLLLNQEVKHFLYPLFLGNGHEEVPDIQLGQDLLRIGGLNLYVGEGERRAFSTLMGLVLNEGDLHLSQTYHLVYPTGTRFLTLGNKAPLPLVYREITPLLVQLV